MTTLRHHDLVTPVLPGLTYDTLAGAMGLFLRFLDEVPQDVKRTLHIKGPYKRQTAWGYSDKRAIMGKDEKEFFHFNLPLMEREEYRRIEREYEAARTFFRVAYDIYHTCEKATEELFRRPQFAPYAAHVLDENGHLVNSVLRFLCYTPKDGGAFSAKGHYDKSAGTIALAESAPGLRIGCCKEHPMTPVVHKAGQAFFMPGSLMWEYSNGRVTPVWHDVIEHTASDPISPRCARWAIVYFIDDRLGRYPSWDEAHTPLPVHETVPA